MLRNILGLYCVLLVPCIGAQELQELTTIAVADEACITRAVDCTLHEQVEDMQEDSSVYRAQVDPTILSCIAEAIVEKYCPQS